MDKGCWVTSSLSTGNGNCLEAWDSGHGVYVRHSKYPDGWVLHFSPDEWAAFTGGVKDGQFDLAQ